MFEVINIKYNIQKSFFVGPARQQGLPTEPADDQSLIHIILVYGDISWRCPNQILNNERSDESDLQLTHWKIAISELNTAEYRHVGPNTFII